MSYPFIFLQGAMQGLAQNICRKLHAGRKREEKEQTLISSTGQTFNQLLINPESMPL